MARRGSGQVWIWIGLAIASFLTESIAGGQSFIPVMDQKDAAVEAAVLKSLDKPVTWNFDSAPLSEVARVVGASIGITVMLDEKPLEDAGFANDTPVTYRGVNVPAGPALELILRRLELTSIPKSGVLLITTPDIAATELRTRVYPVADLILTSNDARLRGDGPRRDFESLIDLITTTITPETWDEVGGPGAISPFRASDSLVISQTHDVHLQIEQLFYALRRSRGVRPTVIGKTSPRKAAVTKSRLSKQVPISSRRHVAATAQPAWRLPHRHEYQGQPAHAAAVPVASPSSGDPPKTPRPARQAEGLF